MTGDALRMLTRARHPHASLDRTQRGGGVNDVCARGGHRWCSLVQLPLSCVSVDKRLSDVSCPKGSSRRSRLALVSFHGCLLFPVSCLKCLVSVTSHLFLSCLSSLICVVPQMSRVNLHVLECVVTSVKRSEPLGTALSTLQRQLRRGIQLSSFLPISRTLPK